MFPLLLLLSKLRPSTSSIVDEGADDEEKDHSAKTISSKSATYSMFIPLVQSCSSMKRYQVRVIAAKALVALVPMEDAILKCVDLSQDLTSMLTRTHKESDKAHGIYMQLFELLQNIDRCILERDKSCDNVSNISPSISKIIDLLSKQVLPNLCSKPYLPFDPPVQLIKVRVLSLIYKMVSKFLSHHNEVLIQSETILESACWQSLAFIISPITNKINYNFDNNLTRLPMMPILWKESTRRLIVLIITYKIESYKADKETENIVSLMCQLLSFPIKEVREGIVEGFLEVFEGNVFRNALIQFTKYLIPNFPSTLKHKQALMTLKVYLQQSLADIVT